MAALERVRLCVHEFQFRKKGNNEFPFHRIFRTTTATTNDTPERKKKNRMKKRTSVDGKNIYPSKVRIRHTNFPTPS